MARLPKPNPKPKLRAQPRQRAKPKAKRGPKIRKRPLTVKRSPLENARRPILPQKPRLLMAMRTMMKSSPHPSARGLHVPKKKLPRKKMTRPLRLRSVVVPLKILPSPRQIVPKSLPRKQTPRRKLSIWVSQSVVAPSKPRIKMHKSDVLESHLSNLPIWLSG